VTDWTMQMTARAAEATAQTNASQPKKDPTRTDCRLPRPEAIQDVTSVLIALSTALRRRER